MQMKNRKWLAICAAAFAALLLAEGIFAYSALEPFRAMSADPDPNVSAEHIKELRDFMPVLYLVLFEGLFFGVVAAILALGFGAGWKWAPRVSVVASIPLALIALVASVLAPGLAAVQLTFVVLCGVLWWEALKWRHASAI